MEVLETAHDGFFALDRKWRYVYVNPTVENYARKRKEEMIGRVIWEVFPDAKKTMFYKKYHEAMETGQEFEFEELIDNKWFDIHVVPFKAGIWVFYRDISDRKLADERKDEFIRLASHELKTPITSLKLYAEMLEEMLPAGEAWDYVRHITAQADKLNHLVSEMLDLSRIQLGKIEFKKKNWNLVEIIKEIMPDLRAAAQNYKLEVHYRATQAPIHVDKNRIIQALNNLIENAVKYSLQNKRIILTVGKNNHDAWVAVQDFGIGIDPAYQDQIFDRFFQATGTKGKTFPGLGVGLYLIKIIAEKHRGDITVKSALGQGSTFTFSLPLHVPVLRKIKK